MAQSSIWSLLGASSLGIDAKSNEPINVYCDLDAGGLTYLFRKHFHSSTEFQVGIETYKSGFGDLEEDFFLGTYKKPMKFFFVSSNELNSLFF